MQENHPGILLLELLPYLVSLAITLGLAVFTFRRRSVLGAGSFSIVILLEVLETGGYLLELVAPTMNGKMLWDNFQWFTSLLIPISILYFSIEYIDRLKPAIQYWIGLLAFISLGLATVISMDLFPGWGILSPHLIAAEPFAVYTYQFGPVILVATAYGYLLALVGYFVLGREVVRQKGIFRQQALIILIGLLIPMLSTVLTLLGVTLLPNRDILPFTFPLANIIIIFGLFRYRIFDIIPIARTSVMDYISDPVAVLDTRDIILDLNPAFEELFKQPRRELINKPIRQILVSLPIMDEVVQHQAFQEECMLQIGEEKFFFDISSKPFNNRLGIYGGKLMIFHNITELKRAEEKLVRHEKLAVLGQLAGGVGHELRNPLGVISNAVYYLKMVQPDATEKIRKHHALIEQEVHNAAKIVGDLLDYARVISANRKPVSIPELVHNTLSRFPVPASVRLSIKIPADLPQVYADPLQMEQVLGNLTTNACQAMKKGGNLTISARQQKQMVALVVEDTGTGITPDNLNKLFEPLFTTKVKGIGLGLAVSKKLAEVNGGRIEVESESGTGSIFTLYLPTQDG